MIRSLPISSHELSAGARPWSSRIVYSPKQAFLRLADGRKIAKYAIQETSATFLG
jgi:hypothetical protein